MRAFSLIELLVVIAIMAILIGLAMTTVGGYQSGGNPQQRAKELALVIEQARTYAMGQNTYVWVGFHEEAQPESLLRVAVVASADGTSDVSNRVPVSPVKILRRVMLSDEAPTGDYADTQNVRRPGGTGSFTNAARLFEYTLLFSPQGSVSLPPDAVGDHILVALKKPVGMSNAIARLRIQPISGQVIYENP